MPYHRRQQRFCSTQNVPSTKVDLCGDRRKSVHQYCLLLMLGDGKRVQEISGNLSGHCFHKQWNRVLNCWGVAAKKGVVATVNVLRQHCDVHHSATVEAAANTITACEFQRLITWYRLCDNGTRTKRRSCWFLLSANSVLMQDTLNNYCFWIQMFTSRMYFTGGNLRTTWRIL